MLHKRKDYNERIQDKANIIPDDEPVFLIRGQDVIAPDTLRFYARSIEDLHVSPQEVFAIRQLADEMEKWPVTKVPSTPIDQLLITPEEPTFPEQPKPIEVLDSDILNQELVDDNQRLEKENQILKENVKLNDKIITDLKEKVSDAEGVIKDMENGDIEIPEPKKKNGFA